MMKKRWIIQIILVLVLILPSTLSAVRLKETWHKTFHARSGITFVLGNTNGSIEVEGWDREEIDILAEIKIKAPSKSKAQKLLNHLHFDIDEGDDRIAIKADLPRIRQDSFLNLFFGDKTSISIDYTVKVPNRADLQLETVNGRVATEEVSGTFDLRTTNGGIDMRSMEGEGEAHAVNGAIEAVIVDLPEDGDLTLKTVNGGIELKLPEGTGGRLEARTINGHIDLELDLRETIKIKRTSVKGILGDGRGTIYLKTTNGSISIDAM